MRFRSRERPESWLVGRGGGFSRSSSAPPGSASSFSQASGPLLSRPRRLAQGSPTATHLVPDYDLRLALDTRLIRTLPGSMFRIATVKLFESASRPFCAAIYLFTRIPRSL